MSQEVEFDKLCAKFSHHYHKDSEDGRELWCLTCQAIGKLEQGQMEVTDAMQSKNREHAQDQGIPF